ncbi:MAG: rod-binding protein [Defluviitaleaceae bacterium]|nr:rod-binding protein [Defluviitaleaceae bacterium]
MDISSFGGNFMNHIQSASRQAPTTSMIESAQLSGNDAALFAAAVEFESYFLSVMFREMRNTVNSDSGILPQSRAQRMFQEMLDEENANLAAQSGGIGLAQTIFRQMSANSAAVAMSVFAQNQAQSQTQS